MRLYPQAVIRRTPDEPLPTPGRHGEFADRDKLLADSPRARNQPSGVPTHNTPNWNLTRWQMLMRSVRDLYIEWERGETSEPPAGPWALGTPS